MDGTSLVNDDDPRRDQLLRWCGYVKPNPPTFVSLGIIAATTRAVIRILGANKEL
jgi:hypothetical protein